MFCDVTCSQPIVFALLASSRRLARLGLIHRNAKKSEGHNSYFVNPWVKSFWQQLRNVCDFTKLLAPWTDTPFTITPTYLLICSEQRGKEASGVLRHVLYQRSSDNTDCRDVKPHPLKQNCRRACDNPDNHFSRCIHLERKHFILDFTIVPWCHLISVSL